ncbi:TPA: type 1 fimbrial protein [Klebsiella aerogenes]|nr:type 1 fimbrial protein [Klebsiella aerogenes]
MHSLICNKNRLIKIIVFLAMLLGAHTAKASVCRSLNVSNGLLYYTATINGFNPPPFDPGAFSIGQTIYTAVGNVTINNANGEATYTCTGTQERLYMSGYGTPTNSVYPTSIPGVGIKMSDDGANYYPMTGPYLPNESSLHPIIGWKLTYPIYFTLIKTGEISTGGQLQGPVLKYTVGNAGGQMLKEVSWSEPVDIRPTIPSCVVQNTSISVPLGNVPATIFSGVGTYSSSVPFDIVLSCSGGSTGSYTDAYVTITDSTNPGNRSNILSLTSDSGAKGIGIQILAGSTLINYGPDSSVVGNTNQWSAGRISQGTSSFVIPLTARYVQTGNIIPGEAVGIATFTMSYN